MAECNNDSSPNLQNKTQSSQNTPLQVKYKGASRRSGVPRSSEMAVAQWQLLTVKLQTLCMYDVTQNSLCV
jgi:hypothetical protein